MEDLIQKRTKIRSRLTKQGNTTDVYLGICERNKGDALKQATMMNAHRLMESTFEELQQIQNEIDEHGDNENRLEAMTPDRLKKENDDELHYNDIYFQMTAKIQLQIDAKPTLAPHGLQNPAAGGNNDGMSADQWSTLINTLTQRKREIQIPKFKGDYHLYDQWKGLIEAEFQKPGYTEHEMAHYTLTLLDGEPQKIVSALKDPGFDEIMEVLDDKYGDIHTKIEQAILEIANMAPVQSNNVKAIDELYNKLVSSWNYILKKTDEDEALTKSSWILTSLVRSKLPKAMIRRWDGERIKDDQKKKDRSHLPILFDDLLQKIHEALLVARRSEVENSPSTGSNSKKSDDRRPKSHGYNTRRSADALQVVPQVKCVFCKGMSHQSADCFSMKKMKIYDRKKSLLEAGACFKCFQVGHRSNECEGSSCSTCRGNHHTMLHFDVKKPPDRRPRTDQSRAKQKSSGDKEDSVKSTNCGLVRPVNEYQGKELLFQSAMAVCESKSSSTQVRVLFDNGSGVTFIRKKTAKKLGLRGPKVRGHFTLAGGSTMELTTERVTMKLFSYIPDWEGDTFEVVAYVLDNPSAPVREVTIDLSKLPHLQGLKLADTYPRSADEVDILLGLEDTLRILMDEKRTGKIGTPIAQKSHFGWILAGPFSSEVDTDVNVVQAGAYSADFELESDNELSLATKHWEIEHLGILPNEEKTSKLNSDEQEALKQFNASTKFVNGRYETGLIRKPEWQDAVLKSNKSFALQRLKSTEKRLEKDPKLKELYQEQMGDLVTRGHAVKVPERETEVEDHTVWYLPHHPVLRMDKSTTKVRPVFDGSAKGPQGISLNDTLLPGPKLQPDLCGILIRFRCNQVAIVADIEKMFHQIRICEKDQDSQRFLWRDGDTSGPPDVYKLTTVTFGLTPSPFSSIKTVRDHAEKMKLQYPVAVEEILHNSFVDDVLTGADSIPEAAQLTVDLKEVLSSGGFPLRKFVSNKKNALCNLEPDELATYHTKLVSDEEYSTKTLGTKFVPEDDVLMFSFCEQMENLEVETRRTILQQLHRVYDPMGLLSPFLITAKILFQQAWTVVGGWDVSLPSEIHDPWLIWKGDVKNLDELKVQRYILQDNNENMKYSVIGFGDASERAYGCCVYLRSEDVKTGLVKVALVCSKTRVSPLKDKRTLPELELMAALITARLVRYVQSELKKKIFTTVMCWTDSMIVLEWISKPSYMWSTFVSNRVSEIQKLVKDWRHVPGKINPADLCSRGCTATELVKSNLWWCGPEFLVKREESWPKTETSSQAVKEQAMKKGKKKYLLQTPVSTVVLTVAVTKSRTEFVEELMKRYATYQEFIRVCIIVKRWFNKYHHMPDEGRIQEYKNEEKFWLRYIQQKHFSEEITALESDKKINKNSRLKALDPVLDDGLLKVGGRLERSTLPDETKNPIILPTNETFVEKMVLWNHRLHDHTGASQTLANLRCKYWLLRGLQETRRIISSCKCKEPEEITQKMAQLPEERVNESPPFSHVGVDYAGPLYVKSGKSSKKSYILIFTCMVVRAVHLELTEDLTADEFLRAFERMMNRRGRVSVLWSDNAQTFKKSADVLKRLFKESGEKITTGLQKHGVEWKFITPRMPWAGGFYERLVKSVKDPLKKVLGRASLTFQEMVTVLTGIECQLNSRPLTVISSDKNDPLPLTPAHFLIGRNLQVIPEVDTVTKKTALGKRWQYRQSLEKSFWNRWRKEYLVELNRFRKWTDLQRNVQVDDLVLIAEDNVKKGQWELGRVIETFKSRDDLVRSVLVKTAAGTRKRPIHKLRMVEQAD